MTTVRFIPGSVLSTALLLLLSPKLLGSNIDLLNPGFENGATAVSNWGAVGPATFGWAFGNPDAETHRGRRALTIGGVAAGGAINSRWTQLSTSYLALTVGQQVAVGAWMKGSSSWDLAKDGYRLQVEFLDASNAILGSCLSTSSGVNPLTAATWSVYTHTSTAAPAGTIKARLSLFFGRMAGSSSSDPVISFDDVSVSLVGSAANYAHPEPIASWGATEFATQRAAAQSLVATVNGAGNGTASNPVVINVAPGDHRFDTATASQLKLIDRSYVHIVGPGARFWFDPFYRDANGKLFHGVEVARCNNIKIDGVTIDYTITPYTQGYVTGINTANGAITFTLQPGFTTPTMIPPGESVPIAAGGKILFFDANGEQIPTLLDYPCSCCGVFLNQGDSFTINPQGGLLLYGGRSATQILSEFVNIDAPVRVVFAARRWRQALALDRTVSSQVSNVTIFGSPQMAIVEQNGNGAVNTYTNCKVIRRPNTDRMLSSNADGFHSLGMSSGPRVTGCEIGHTGDDILNVHGYIGYVYNLEESSNRFTMLTQIVPDTAAPSAVRFYTQPYLKPRFDPDHPGEDFNVLTFPAPTAITSSTDPLLVAANRSLRANGFPSAFQNFLGYPVAPVVQLTVDKSPGENGIAGARIVRGDLVMKRSNIAAGAVIEDNYFHDCFARGIILSGENSSITSNRLFNIGSCSIRVAPDIRFMEGPYSRHITISNNLIERNGWSSYVANDSNNVLIGAITVTGDALFGTRATPASAEHSNIAVTDNTIVQSTNCGIFVSDVTVGEISGNTIQSPYCFGISTEGVGWRKLDFQPAPNMGLCVANSDSLTVQDNTVTSSAPAPAVPAFQSYGWLTNFTGP